MRTAAIIYFYGRKYQEIGGLAVKSFRKHHPDVDLYYINDSNEINYDIYQHKSKITLGVYKLLLAAEIKKKHNYDKIITLGADTITCARLDEFLDDWDHDILATLDYPYPLIDGDEENLLVCPSEETHLNADVICFTNVNAMIDIAKVSPMFPNYAEQAALNMVVWNVAYNYSSRIVDGPYENTPVLYNVRSKGNINLPYDYQDHSATTGVPPKYGPTEKPWGEFLNQFYVQDEKLYNKDHKQIKVWHYCEGFGNLSEEDFKTIMNNYIFKWFNDETKKFFKEHCDAGDFFEKEFSFQ